MIEIPSSMEPAVIADWAELSCLFGDQDSISRSKVEQTLEDANFSDSEGVVADVWQEISRRHDLVGTAHPVITLEGRLERCLTWDHASVYAFQLLLASHSMYSDMKISGDDWKKAAKLFERLSTLALERYLGGKAINIGFPRESGVPKGFRQCLDYLCQQLSEDRGPVESYNVSTKDERVDVVAWQPFADMRSGQVIIFASCAAGANWKDKIGEVNLEVWKSYIDWVTAPLIAFAFPFVCLDDSQWIYLSKLSGGFLLDRLRIASIFVPVDRSFDTMQTEVRTWCQAQQASLPWLD